MNIASNPTRFAVTRAQSSDDVMAVQRLRFDVFGREMGANGTGIDHAQRVESDHFDAFADHLLLRDLARSDPDQVIGTYRLLRADQAVSAGGFYSEREFDLSPLIAGRRDVLELSRSCIHKDYRGGLGLMHLWQALAAYVEEHNIAYLFGVASFAGTNLVSHDNSLKLLHKNHLAPRDIRPVVKGGKKYDPEQILDRDIDQRAAMVSMPSLIKAYLRMGGVIGSGAYIDDDFQTVDVCMILETAQLTARQRAMLGTG